MNWGAKRSWHDEVKSYSLVLFALRQTGLCRKWYPLHLCRYLSNMWGSTVSVWTGHLGFPLRYMKNSIWKRISSCVCKAFWPVLTSEGDMKYSISLWMHCAVVEKVSFTDVAKWVVGEWNMFFHAGMWSRYWVNSTAAEKRPEMFQKPEVVRSLVSQSCPKFSNIRRTAPLSTTVGSTLTQGQECYPLSHQPCFLQHWLLSAGYPLRPKHA